MECGSIILGMMVNQGKLDTYWTPLKGFLSWDHLSSPVKAPLPKSIERSAASKCLNLEGLKTRGDQEWLTSRHTVNGW
jgi:hypothetical protein